MEFNFFQGFFCFFVFSLFMDFLRIQQHKRCKKKFSGKKCKNFQCKYFNICSSYYEKGFPFHLSVLARGGFYFIDKDNRHSPTFEFEEKEFYPVVFVRDWGDNKETRITICNREELFEFYSFLQYEGLHFSTISKVCNWVGDIDNPTFCDEVHEVFDLNAKLTEEDIDMIFED